MIDDQSKHELKRELECLVSSFQFETFWNYYQQCDGHLFERECRKAAVQFFENVSALPSLSKELETTPGVASLHKWTSLHKESLVISDEVDQALIRLPFV